jgi:hypothetical protein
MFRAQQCRLSRTSKQSREGRVKRVTTAHDAGKRFSAHCFARRAATAVTNKRRV